MPVKARSDSSIAFSHSRYRRGTRLVNPGAWRVDPVKVGQMSRGLCPPAGTHLAFGAQFQHSAGMLADGSCKRLATSSGVPSSSACWKTSVWLLSWSQAPALVALALRNGEFMLSPCSGCVASFCSTWQRPSFALYAWDAHAWKLHPCLRRALHTYQPSMHDGTVILPSAVTSSTA